MYVVLNSSHRSHAPLFEMHRGERLPPFECPARLDAIAAAVGKLDFVEQVAASRFDRSVVETVHDPAYVEFLSTVFDEWQAANLSGDLLPHVWPARGLRGDRVPESIFGRLGYYSFDAATEVTSGTWEAVWGGVEATLTATNLAWSKRAKAFSLSRPPGHHAGRDFLGGYCFLNFAAIAAEGFRNLGADRVAVLDVDYHHGNGTQQIFYDRGDVFFGSIHASPAIAYPYFLGYEDERGAGKGEGANKNSPLPDGTKWREYERELESQLDAIGVFSPDAIVVSFGADTYFEDPISGFGLQTADFTRMSQRIATLDLPAVIVMEGGYAIENLGDNVSAFLQGWVGPSR